MSEFSNRFKQLKEEHKLTLKELSEDLDISSPNLSYYIKGREPNYDTLIKIADYFDVTTDWLIGRSDARTLSQENLYNQIDTHQEHKLNDNSKADFLSCQKTLYDTIENLYTLFTLIQEDSELTKLVSKLIDTSAFVLSDSIKTLSDLSIYTSKRNILKTINFGESCAQIQQQLYLALFYRFAKAISNNDTFLSLKEQRALREILTYVYTQYKEKFPSDRTEHLLNELENFSLEKDYSSVIHKLLSESENDQ